MQTTRSSREITPSSTRSLAPATLAALEAAGYTTFFDVIDLEREDLLRIPAIGPEDADSILALIEELTVEDDSTVGAEEPGEGGETESY